MSEVAETGDGIVITKNGQPVAPLGPVILRPITLSGAHKARVLKADGIKQFLAQSLLARFQSSSSAYAGKNR